MAAVDAAGAVGVNVAGLAAGVVAVLSAGACFPRMVEMISDLNSESFSWIKALVAAFASPAVVEEAVDGGCLAADDAFPVAGVVPGRLSMVR